MNNQEYKITKNSVISSNNLLSGTIATGEIDESFYTRTIHFCGAIDGIRFIAKHNIENAIYSPKDQRMALIPAPGIGFSLIRDSKCLPAPGVGFSMILGRKGFKVIQHIEAIGIDAMQELIPLKSIRILLWHKYFLKEKNILPFKESSDWEIVDIFCGSE